MLTQTFSFLQRPLDGQTERHIGTQMDVQADEQTDRQIDGHKDCRRYE